MIWKKERREAGSDKSKSECQRGDRSQIYYISRPYNVDDHENKEWIQNLHLRGKNGRCAKYH